MGETISVEFQEPFSIAVGKFILSKGFVPATSWGNALSRLVANNCLGMLYRDPEAPRRNCLLRLILGNPRRAFLGKLWFHNWSRKVVDGKWLFEINGRKYLEMATGLAKEMAARFNVEIAVRLVSEEPETESFISDYDD